MDTTAVASNTRHPGDNERLVLEEVQVPPFLFDGVVNLAATRFARWTRKGGALPEIYVKSQLTLGGIEIGLGHLPGRDQAKSGGEKWVGVHADTLG